MGIIFYYEGTTARSFFSHEDAKAQSFFATNFTNGRELFFHADLKRF